MSYFIPKKRTFGIDNRLEALKRNLLLPPRGANASIDQKLNALKRYQNMKMQVQNQPSEVPDPIISETPQMLKTAAVQTSMIEKP